MGYYTLSEQKTEIEIHKIIQYLGAAANSFLAHKRDDSHTSLVSLTDCGCIATQFLNTDRHQLAFNYEAFALEWWDFSGEKIRYPLHQKTHKEVVAWISQKARENDISKPFNPLMHYELPYETITDDYVYLMDNPQRLKELMHYRILAHIALENTLESHKPHSAIRVWPHHFDIGSIYMLNKHKGHTIGIGMAIPDELEDQFYFYVKGYTHNQTIATDALEELEYGNWNAQWQGAIYPMDDEVTIEKATHFFNQAINILKSQGRIH